MEELQKALINTVRHPVQAVQEMGGKTLATMCKVCNYYFAVVIFTILKGPYVIYHASCYHRHAAPPWRYQERQ